MTTSSWTTPQVFDPEFRKQFPSVERYFTTLARQPKFAAVVGSDVQLCSEPPKGELRISNNRQNPAECPTFMIVCRASM